MQTAPSDLYTLAQQQLAANQLEAAINTCQQAIAQAADSTAKDQNLAWLYDTLGKAYQRQTAWELAAQAFQQAIARDPLVSWFHYELGRCRVQMGDWLGSVQALQQSLVLNPDFVWAYFLLGEIWLDQDQAAAAADVFAQAVKRSPDEAIFQAKLAYARHVNAGLPMTVAMLLKHPPKLYAVHGETGLLNVSIELLQLLDQQVNAPAQTLESGAGLSTILFALKGVTHHCVSPSPELVEKIQVYCQRHQISTASITFHIQRFEDYLTDVQLYDLDLILLDSDHLLPHLPADWLYTAPRLKAGGLAVINNLQVWTGAVLREFLKLEANWEWIADLSRDFPNSAIFRKLYQNQNQNQNQQLQASLDPKMLDPEQWQMAIQSCEDTVEIDATGLWFYKTLAEAYLEQHRWPEAITASQTALRLSSEAWLHHILGRAYLGQEQWSLAVAACERAIQLNPQVSWFHYHLGEAWVKSGHWQQAISALQQAIDLDPDFPWAYYYLGEALLATQAVEAAIAVYQQALQKHPEIDYLHDCLAYAQHLRVQEERIQAYCQQTQQQHSAHRLRILMITPYPTYPPKLGAITRMFHEMRVLGSHHELVVVSFIFEKGDYLLEAELTRYCTLGLTVVIGDAPSCPPDQPSIIHRYSSQRFRQVLHLLQPAAFDVLLCDVIYMAQYLDCFPQAFPVLSEFNIESELLKRCAAVHPDNTQVAQLAQERAAIKAFVESKTEAEKLARFEDEHWSKFPLRMVVSALDQQVMDARCPVGRTLVVNNGIDTQTIQLTGQLDSQKILFIGTLSYFPNIDGVQYFVEQILPLIWQQNPSVRFCIAGAEPPPQILDLMQEPRIQVIANPDDMGEVAQDCCMTVVPLRIGSGTRIKILHSMAMGLPVISTRLGCEGLQVVDGQHLLVRDQPTDFAAAVQQLIGDPALQQRLRQQGRCLVEQTYDWQQIFTAAEQEIRHEFLIWKAQQLHQPT
jgi:tetratricopeptide (TPR) repeat protein/glycosyltransferase involved in cell wall biosynthesis